MGNVLVKEETLTQIADAIRGKTGTTQLLKPGEMPSAIDEISTYSGEGADPNKPIRFYGIDGQLLYSYSTREIMDLTELPAAPECEGMIFQNWNWSLESIQNLSREVNVGAIYITDDGSTRIYVSLTKDRLSPVLGFAQNKANGVQVDWGVGSELETTDVWGNEAPVGMSHTYSEPGDYIIRLIPQGDTKINIVGYSSGSYLLCKAAEYNDGNKAYLSAIKKIEIGKQVRIDDYGLYYLGIENITIPEDIIYVTEGFHYCYFLEYLAIPKSIEYMQSYFCSRCYRLKKVCFSDSVKSLSTYAFSYCFKMEDITLPDNMENIWSYSFLHLYALESVKIPKGLTSVATSMFEYCYLLEEVILPDSIKHIEGSAFSSCSSLRKINIPNGVVQIGSKAFYSCISLQQIELPETLEAIIATAFRGCHSLAEITIPASVTQIGASAFASNCGVENYYILPTIPPTLGSNAFDGISATCKIHVPKGCLEAYQTAENWSTYADYMVEMEE